MNLIFLFTFLLLLARSLNGRVTFVLDDDDTEEDPETQEDEQIFELPSSDLEHNYTSLPLPYPGYLPLPPPPLPPTTTTTPLTPKLTSIPAHNPDHLEFLVLVTMTKNALDIHLNCELTKTAMDTQVYDRLHTVQFDGEFFELFQKNHFPFTWVNASRHQLPHLNPVLGGYTHRGVPFFICNDYATIGTVSMTTGVCRTMPNTFKRQIRSQQSVDSGHSRFQLLVNPANVEYSWVNVTDWEKVPVNSVLTSGHLYIARIQAPSATESSPQIVALSEKHRIENRIEEQVLVVAQPAEQSALPDYRVSLRLAYGSPMMSLVCSKTTLEQLGKYQEMTNVKTSKQAEFEQEIKWRIFKKIPALLWVNSTSTYLSAENPVFGGRETPQRPTYVCRCVDCFDGQTIPGYVSLKSGLCHLTSNGTAHTLSAYQVLSNPTNLDLSWRPFHADEWKSQTNGAVIGGDQGGVRYFIGRIMVNESLVIIGKLQPEVNTFSYVSEEMEEAVIEADRRVWVLSTVPMDLFLGRLRLE